jgi:hypothetical protein
VIAQSAGAATPSSGTIAPGQGLTWSGPFTALGANISDQIGVQECDGDPGAVPVVETCDVFELTVHVPQHYWNKHRGGVVITIDWQSANNNFDLWVFRKPAPGQPLAYPVSSSVVGGVNHQEVRIPNADGTYLIRINPFQVVADQYRGNAAFFYRRPIPKVPGGLPQYRASHSGYLSYSEPSIAVNPRNPDNLVAGSKMYQSLPYYRFKIGTFVSYNGGRTWRDNGILPGFPAQNGSEANYYLTSDIWTAFDNLGTAYAMILDNPTGNLTAGGWGMTLEKSPDGGRSWSGPIPIHRNQSPITQTLFLDDKDALAVDNTSPRSGKPGNLYACWSYDTPNSNLAIAFSRSTDGGLTWSPGPNDLARPISALDRSVLGCQIEVAPSARAGEPGIVYVFWLDFGNSSIRMVKSTDGGVTFSLPTTVVNINPTPGQFPNSEFRTQSLPAAGVDPRTGAVYVTWADYHATQANAACPPDPTAPPNQVCDADILLARSTDGGTTWSAPTRVNQDPVGDGKDQFEPALAVSPNGTLNMMWFDRRNDPADFYIDTYVGVSHDGGRTWRETRVTKSMWDPSINPPFSDSGQFIGDYQGIAATNTFAFPFWQDTSLASLRPSNPRYSPYQQVFSARVPNTPLATRPIKSCIRHRSRKGHHRRRRCRHS